MVKEIIKVADSSTVHMERNITSQNWQGLESELEKIPQEKKKRRNKFHKSLDGYDCY